MSDTPEHPADETRDEKIARLQKEADILKRQAQRDDILPEDGTENGVGPSTGLVP